NVTHVTNVTNVTNVTYVNQRAPGAVTVVSRADFTTARPLSRAGLRVPASAVVSAPVAGSAPEVAPRRESVLAHRVDGRVARPPDAAVNRTVMTKRIPPPPPVSFSARQGALKANPGQPVDAGTLGMLRQTDAPRPQVRSATAPALAAPARVERPPELGREPLRQQQPERAQRPPEPIAVPQERARPERGRPERREPDRANRPQPQAAPPEQRREERRATQEERSRKQGERREKEKSKPE